MGRTKTEMLMTTVALLIHIEASVVEALRIDVKSGSTKCIKEEMQLNTMTIGKYAVVNPFMDHDVPDTHKITVRVTSPFGQYYHYSVDTDHGNFAFTASEEGDHTICFRAADHTPPYTVSVEFEWKSGYATIDWSKIAKRRQIQVVEFELRKMFDTVLNIHDEMFYLRERGEEMQKLNRATNTKMATFSFLSLLVCLSVAALQIWHLKKFFERKKLV
ncbi:transmembrane emp24 domain-containing protein p24delta7-like [Ipomoea triloba]|uniref:transmembrane emp24 domain-containing protein p24delta7-like n=1 Tax=Ipomoea triloba TaxID=35885 RepID=UPI00125CFA00|nr:transmembrane emp24 domain-containing protein p24delta7-like [Ipomoea triloba]GMD49888.1 transmembrane emp24 domain-containing protein p24delta7-like [Ipomoea batatas]GMD51903.1 transmembrane emp24 domain-containing protein p24delta7-like [Ipomoea batatas]GMD54064.1 transmembrane emp24 domain-containing protein p24delta7-like [Ipomoea batatas]GMD56942.1 transmembrane emp24 domain-containing protein p24delta7-like [Ipomoea batatas]GMD58783.1 transmembrane emp24 domain-containing protein p24d